MKKVILLIIISNYFTIFCQSTSEANNVANTFAVFLGMAQNAKKSGDAGIGMQLDWFRRYNSWYAFGLSTAYNRVDEHLDLHRYTYIPSVLDNQTIYQATHSHIIKKAYDNIRLNGAAKLYFTDIPFSPYILGGAGVSFSSVKETSSSNIVRTYPTLDDVPDYYTSNNNEKDSFLKPVFSVGAGLSWGVTKKYSLELQYQYIVHTGLFQQHFIALGLSV